jgi:hypothetical protein
LDIHNKNNPADIAMPLGNITGFNLKKRNKAVRQTRRGGFLFVLNDMTPAAVYPGHHQESNYEFIFFWIKTRNYPGH